MLQKRKVEEETMMVKFTAEDTSIDSSDCPWSGHNKQKNQDTRVSVVCWIFWTSIQNRYLFFLPEAKPTGLVEAMSVCVGVCVSVRVIHLPEALG